MEKKVIFNKEMRRAKRIVQVKPKRQFKNPRMMFSAAANAVYDCRGAAIDKFIEKCAPLVVNQNATASSFLAPVEINAEYLAQSFCEGGFFTLGDSKPIIAFQVLWKIPRGRKFVVRRERGPTDYYIQPLLMLDEEAAWNAAGDNFPASFKVFSDGAASWKDLSRLADWDVLRHKARRWRKEATETLGVYSLVDPKSAVQKLTHLGYNSSSYPLLLMVEELLRRGWERQRKDEPITSLKKSTPARFSRMMLIRRAKIYFQVLLSLPEIFGRGLTELAHTRTLGYYETILKSPHPDQVPTNRKASEYEDALTRLEPVAAFPDDDPDVGALLSDHEVNDEEICGGLASSTDTSSSSEDEPMVPIAGARVREALLSDNEEETPGLEKESGALLDPVSAPVIAKLSLPLVFEGMIYDLDKYEHHSTLSRGHCRIICKTQPGCSCPAGHEYCGRKRSTKPLLEPLRGEWAPIVFLLAWSRSGVYPDGAYAPNPVAHRGINPSEAAWSEASPDLAIAFPQSR